jgi:hypothetical protein
MIEKNRGNKNGIPLSGIGYIVIPKNCNVAEYIQNCYRNSSVSISGGYGCTYMHNVKITTNALNEIKFPTEGEFGSPVVWIRDSFTNRAVVIGVLTSGKSNLTGMFQHRIFQEIAQRVAEIFIDAMNSRVIISALGDDNVPSEVIIKASSNRSEGDVVRVISKDIIESESKRLKISLLDKIELLINDGEKDILSINGDSESFRIKDQFGNSLSMSEKTIEIKDQFENYILMDEENININSKKLNVAGGSEPMVLGNKLSELLKELIDAISSLTVVTPNGPSGTPLNATQFAQVKGKLQTILSNLSYTD